MDTKLHNLQPRYRGKYAFEIANQSQGENRFFDEEHTIQIGTFVDTEPKTGSPVRVHLAYRVVGKAVEQQVVVGK